MPKLVNNLDFAKYEARNLRLQNLAAAPSSPVLGQAYFDTALGRPRVWAGSSWEDMTTTAGVTAVGASAPITSTGGATPTIGITAATAGAAGSMSAADKSKLDGVAAGATANSSDVTLLNRANHTGSQAVSTVTGLQAALDAKVDDSQVGAAGGVASLDAGGKVPSSQLPAIAFTNVSVVADLAARNALTGMAEGDVAVVNGDRSYIWTGTAWEELDSATDGVITVGAGTGITIGGSATNPTVGIAGGGVGVTELAAAVAGNGLTGGGGAALAVNVGSGLDISADAVRIAAAAAGNGLTGGGGSALAVGAGTGITVSADAVAVNTAVVVRKGAAVSVGDGVATSFVVTHNLGSRDVTVQVYANAAPYDDVLVDVERTDVNSVTVRFGTAPAASAYRVVVQG